MSKRLVERGPHRPNGLGDGAGGSRTLSVVADNHQPPAIDHRWRDSLICDVRNGQRQVKANQANLVTILGADPRWCGVLVFNEFAQRVETVRPPQWTELEAGSAGPQVGPWTDDDDTRLQAWLERVNGLSYRVEAIARGVMLAAKNQPAFHPVREYLAELSWDGRERLPLLFSQYFGAVQSPYLRRVGVWWPVSAVARVMVPGCKVDTVLILEGPQGAKKSQALAALAVHRQWVLDTPLPIGDKDSVSMMCGKWIVEFAELESWRGKHAAQVKAFLSRGVDHYRPPYGRRAVDVSRQCVFAATTNEQTYLDDATGARRQWPVACGAIDLRAIEADRAQLWAEAVTRYSRGEHWWPNSAEDHELCRQEQEARRIADPWELAVRERLAMPEHRKVLDDGKLTTHYVLTQCLDLSALRIGKAEAMRVGEVLRLQGLVRTKRRIERSRVEWVYLRPSVELAGEP